MTELLGALLLVLLRPLTEGSFGLDAHEGLVDVLSRTSRISSIRLFKLV